MHQMSILSNQRIISDLPSVQQCPSILFFGGSFDPPHEGHRTLPDLVSDASPCSFDGIVFAPAAQSPHKGEAPTSSQHRLEMLGLAIRSCQKIRIWTTELDRSNDTKSTPSYWFDTWNTVRSSRPDAPDRFLIGADQALAMHRWHKYECFWHDALVMLRDEQDAPEQLIESMRALNVWDKSAREQWKNRIVRVPLIDASSTKIRSALRDPDRRENPIAGLDDRVHEYILEHGLYRA